MNKTLVLLLLAFALVLGGCGPATLKPAAKPEAASNQNLSAKNTNQNVNQPVDEVNWNEYTNSQLGFYLKVPKQALIANASCQAVRKDGQSLYQPKAGLVPVKVFAEAANNKAYVNFEYSYEASGDTVPSDNGLLYAQCEKKVNSLTSLKAQGAVALNGWTMVFAAVADDEALEQFIKTRYGSGCSLGAKTASKVAGIYDVTVKGDGKDLEETKCPINYWTVVKYSPTLKKVAAWDIGQDYRFRLSIDADGVDQTMIDSFYFVE